MLEQNTIPILVGGTHYYIQSVIWDLLIDKDPQKTDDSNANIAKSSQSIENGKLIFFSFTKQFLILKNLLIDSKVVKLIYECIGTKEADSKQNTFETDFNVRLHDSDITNEEIYKQLELVDLESAKKIHPNDRRKACR